MGGRARAGGCCARATAAAHARPRIPLHPTRRPPEQISTPQQLAVTATGIIWSRFSTQITPARGQRAGAGGGAPARRRTRRLRVPLLGASKPLEAAPPPLSQVNYNLLAVNAFMACTGSYQLARKWAARGDAASVAA